MKKLFFIVCMFLPFETYAYDFPTTCSSYGFTTIEERGVIVSDTSCPSGYTELNNQNSNFLVPCVSDSMGICLMYVPSNTSYPDDTGWFEYTEPCMLE